MIGPTRLLDLVRHQRGALLDADLITEDEYASLAAEQGAVARLEEYDAMRARLAAVEAKGARVLVVGSGDTGTMEAVRRVLAEHGRDVMLNLHGDAAVTALPEPLSLPADLIKRLDEMCAPKERAGNRAQRRHPSSGKNRRGP